MTDVAVKRKVARAKRRAMQILEKSGYQIVPSTNKDFCFIGIRKNEIRMIRIAIDEITEKDKSNAMSFNIPGNCTKEIWCKRGRDFQITEL